MGEHNFRALWFKEKKKATLIISKSIVVDPKEALQSYI